MFLPWDTLLPTAEAPVRRTLCPATRAAGTGSRAAAWRRGFRGDGNADKHITHHQLLYRAVVSAQQRQQKGWVFVNRRADAIARLFRLKRRPTRRGQHWVIVRYGGHEREGRLHTFQAPLSFISPVFYRR